MTKIFISGGESVAALSAITAHFEARERARRAEEAEDLRLLAEAVRLASEEDSRCGTRIKAPTGEIIELSGGGLAHRSVRAELAAVARVSERTIERRMSHAYALVREYPDAFEAFSEGEIDEGHARVIVEAGLVIGEANRLDTLERRARYESAVLEVAVTTTPTRLRPIARQLAELHAEVSLDERFEIARRRRRVWVTDHPDGMSDLVAHLPFATAHGIFNRLTSAAVVEEGRDRDPLCDRRRSRNEVRADLFEDLLCAEVFESVGEGKGAVVSGVQATVQLRITDRTLFQRMQQLAADADAVAGSGRRTAASTASSTAASTVFEPALLTGCGPIDSDTGVRLAVKAKHWQVLTEHPETGVVMSVDRYRPSEKMRRLIAARDEHCRFVGCRAPVSRCDIDHTVDAAKGGATSTDNLAMLCRGHHMLKHHGGWRVKQSHNGTLKWKSPTGRVYKDRPPSRVRFEALRTEPPGF